MSGEQEERSLASERREREIDEDTPSGTCRARQGLFPALLVVLCLQAQKEPYCHEKSIYAQPASRFF